MSSVHWRSQDFVLRGPENQGAEFEWGWEWAGGIPLPSELGGLRERRKFPQRGPEWSLGGA